MEVSIENRLNKEGIGFIPQCRKDRFPWLGGMSFDFYLPAQNIAIECQGVQHFEPRVAFGGEDNFKKCVERDEIKRNLARENGVILIYHLKKEYLRYTENLTEPVFTTLDDLLNFIKSSPNVSAIEKDSVSLQQN